MLSRPPKSIRWRTLCSLILEYTYSIISKAQYCLTSSSIFLWESRSPDQFATPYPFFERVVFFEMSLVRRRTSGQSERKKLKRKHKWKKVNSYWNWSGCGRDRFRPDPSGTCSPCRSSVGVAHNGAVWIISAVVDYSNETWWKQLHIHNFTMLLIPQRAGIGTPHVASRPALWWTGHCILQRRILCFSDTLTKWRTTTW